MKRNLSLLMLFGLLIGGIYLLYDRAQSIPKFIDESLLRTNSEHEFGDLRFFIVGDTGTGNTAQYQQHRILGIKGKGHFKIRECPAELAQF